MAAALRRAVCLLLALALYCPTSCAQAAFRLDVRSGYGLTRMLWLSDYNANLRGSDYDTPVYLLSGDRPGATALAMGGTHAREIAGVAAATLMVENARVLEGRLFVVPCVNAAGMSVPDSLGNRPRVLEVAGRSGARFLPWGDRYIPLRPGEKDPEAFRHPSGFVLKNGAEWRNINRNYPGRADGTPAERVTFAVMELIRREGVAFSLDMHEARTFEDAMNPKTGKVGKNSLLANSLIAHPRALDLAAEALFLLEEWGTSMKLEQSAPGYRGICHYEIGENTDCLAFLSETPNPGMNEWSASPDPLGLRGYPIAERVGIAVEVFRALCAAYNDRFDRKVVVEGLPTRFEVQRDGLAGWLN